MPKKKSKDHNPLLHILVVDHDPQPFRILQAAEIEENIKVSWAGSLEKALTDNEKISFDIILLKNRLPDGVACDVVPTLLKSAQHPELLIYSQYGDPEEAESILGSGCWDYVVDPALPESIVNHLRKVIQYRRNKSGKDQERQNFLYKEIQSEGIIGSSTALQHCLNLMVKAAQTDANVLITGESGTGKELFASSLHSVSSRANNEFVVVDCAALTPTLVESILFGHLKGSFTGADRNKTGLIKQADKGTLFLDEIGEMPLEIQKKFLRVLQEQTFRPVGSNVEIKSNFRLVAASNKNLPDLSQKHEFREDLLFRVRTFHLELPPLRDRQEDITELAYFYRDQYCRRNKVDKKFSTAFLLVLKQYDWPGNVRELFHALERSLASAVDTDILYPLHLPPDIRIKVTHNALKETGGKANHLPVKEEPQGGQIDLSEDLQNYRDRVVAQSEQNYLLDLVAFTDGDLKQCLEISGLSRSRFYALLKKYNISLQSKKG
jgi:two-component system NtrC family response regulator